MRTLDELREYYNSVLVPDLKVLEVERKKAFNKIFFAAVIIAGIAIPFSIFFKHFFPAILGIILWVFIYQFSIKEYVSAFKTDIIAKIINSIDPDLKYSKFGHVSESTFMASRIFQKSPDEFDGDDHVSGKIGQTSLDFSEIHAKYITHDSRGRRQQHTIFKGLFLAADFNKHFKNTLIILPDTAEKLFGNIGTFLQTMNKMRGELIKLEDPEFERHFAVYGKDQVEARYILSTSLMKRITDFKKKSGRNVYLSFTGSQIFIAIAYSRDLFEPRVFRTVLDFVPIQQYYEDLKLAIDVVEDLNLNTRIWGK